MFRAGPKLTKQPRAGDIAAFYDAKLKGKKGLSSYNQHVGSVEDPLVGVIAESEQKKHKLRVMQVERGVSCSCVSKDGRRLIQTGTGGSQLSV
jgi:hypothetical protein